MEKEKDETTGVKTYSELKHIPTLIPYNTKPYLCVKLTKN